MLVTDKLWVLTIKGRYYVKNSLVIVYNCRIYP